MISAALERSLEIRPALPEDQAFVSATFAEQLSRGGAHDANAIVDRVIDSDATRILIALEHGRIVGWLAYAAIPRVRAVLFVYVRKNNRLGGIAHELASVAWPRGGAWVHAGLRGSSTKSVLQKFQATQMSLEDLL